MEISNENSKKVWILSIIGILSLIILTIGATYAYFTFSSDNQFGSQTIEATTEAIGSGVTLTKVGEPLTLDVSALQMLEENIGTSYYASGSEEPAQIGKISVAGDGTFNCTYTMTVSATSSSEDKNLYTKFQNFSDKSEGQIYLDVNETRYDFNTANLFPITYQGTIEGITNAEEQYITANMTIANTDIDQTVLNDADISLTFEVTQFDCELDTSKPASEEIMAMQTTGLNTSLEGGLYRYQGTSINNYICFGTSDKSTCTGNTDAYMYRIIGINDSGQLKLIKKEALDNTMQWYSDSTTNITWRYSTIYSNINGSSFLTNTTYVPSGWSDKIATTSWKYGDNKNDNVTASSLYTTENGWTNTVSAKIGLMYAHDYAYAYQSGGLNCSSDTGNYSTCKTAWLHLSNCDSGAPSTYEWTMSRYGYYSTYGVYLAWYVNNYGYVGSRYKENTASVRPVFFLESSVKFIGGSGTSADPFIIK